MTTVATAIWLLILAAAQLSYQSPLSHVLQQNDHLTTANMETTSNSAKQTNNQYLDSILFQRDSTPSIYIKTNASDCNIEGSLGSQMHSSDFTALPISMNSILDCQQRCQRSSSCYSYSWTSNDNEGGYNCTLYGTWIGHTPGAVNVGTTGLFFSDKHVEDGTIWCYSPTPFMGSGLPGGPIIIT